MGRKEDLEGLIWQYNDFEKSLNECKDEIREVLANRLGCDKSALDSLGIKTCIIILLELENKG